MRYSVMLPAEVVVMRIGSKCGLQGCRSMKYIFLCLELSYLCNERLEFPVCVTHQVPTTCERRTFLRLL